MSYPYLSDVVKALTGHDFPLPIAMFGLFVVLGMGVGAILLRTRLLMLQQNGLIGNGWRTQQHHAGVKRQEITPAELVPDFAMVVIIAGIVGARLFHILEHMDSFLASPWDMIFSRSGLSVFGGLFFGALAGLVMLKKWHLPARPFLDAIAPAMMLGYAIGRVGCQISGDGDWGHAANMSLKPNWLPDWLWAQTYDNNIFGIIIPSPGVYPTPIYESLMSLMCFALLWKLRNHRNKTGWLFYGYLVLVGIERLLIEQIRVNPVLDAWGVRGTQAEMIAVVLVIVGLTGMLLLRHGNKSRETLIN